MPHQRLCVVCRQFAERDELVRLRFCRQTLQWRLRSPGELDDNRHFGRSAYVCPTPDCLKAVLSGKRLAKALKTSIPDDIVLALSRLASSLSNA